MALNPLPPENISYGGVRVGDMSREQLIETIGMLDRHIGELAAEAMRQKGVVMRILPGMLYDNAVAWFRAMWPSHARRREVIEQYRSLGATHRALLADIALRANLFGPIRADNDRQAAIEEGRRQLAVEIFKLARADHDLLWEQIEKRPAKPGEKA